ncbi:MAG: hypothetical protein QQN63_11965 [Nitrosopumilus sp.]
MDIKIEQTTDSRDGTIAHMEQYIERLIDVLTVALDGLVPTATVNQQNLAYYTVREMLLKIKKENK